MASFRIKSLAQIALNQAKLDFSGSALRERYLRKVTVPRLNTLDLTPECQEFQEAYTLAMEALRNKSDKMKAKGGILRFLRSLLPSSPKVALL